MDPRLAAHRILTEVRRGRFAGHVAERVLPQVAPKGRGLTLEIAYGCLRLRERLDTRILALTDRPRHRIDPEVLDWLRMGVYELTELRTPDHAAVHETVKQARRRMDAGGAGFINAVLRAATSASRDPFPDRTDPLAYLTSYGSHPAWLVRRWLNRWGVEAVTALVEHGNSRPPVVLQSLEADDALPPLPDTVALRRLDGWPGAYELECGSPAMALAHVRAVIQDPAASAVVHYLGDGFSPPVYDACAAPGTKTMVVAWRTNGVVIAADLSLRRLRRVAPAADRLGLTVRGVVADAREPAVASAATVLADVPCTGTGVLRRRPDARWRIEEAGLQELVGIQREILDESARIVEKGGTLLYSTCSLEREENEMQVASFLDRNRDFRRDPNLAAGLPDGCLTLDGDLFVRPWITGTDGAYAARLRRVR